MDTRIGPPLDLDAPREASRPRRIALRIVVALFLLLVLAAFNVLLVFPFIAWLPTEVFVEAVGYPAEDVEHLVHAFAIGLWYGPLVLCLAAQLRRPERSVAPLWLIALIMASQIVYDLAIRDIGDPLWLLAYALTLALVVLHPRRTARITTVDRPVLTMVVLAAVPLALYGWDQLRLQLGPDDPSGHVAGNHYFVAAGLAGLLLVAGSIGSTDLPGARLVAWIAGCGSVLFAVASLAHPELESAWPTGWAAAAVVWGAGYLALVARGRRLRMEPGNVPAARSSRPDHQ